MKKMIRRGLVLVVIAAMTLSAASIYAGDAGSAAQGDFKKDAHFKKMAEELQLTPQQKAALEKDREEFSAKSKALRDKMQITRKSLKEELDKAATDKARVESLVTELKNLYSQQIQYRVDKVMAMKQILTPEQFNKMKSSMESRKHDKDGKHGYKDKGKGEGKGDHGPDDMI